MKRVIDFSCSFLNNWEKLGTNIGKIIKFTALTLLLCSILYFRCNSVKNNRRKLTFPQNNFRRDNIFKTFWPFSSYLLAIDNFDVFFDVFFIWYVYVNKIVWPKRNVLKFNTGFILCCTGSSGKQKKKKKIERNVLVLLFFFLKCFTIKFRRKWRDFKTFLTDVCSESFFVNKGLSLRTDIN